MSETEQSTAPRDLLVTLVDTQSVSGSEAACAQRLVEFFEEHDREAYTDEVGNVHAPGDSGVLLTSHIDTVPGDIDVCIEETEAGEPALWGRGSVDAKGPLASMAVVACRTGAGFLGVVGEETDSRGARHAVQRLDAPAALINGEPSGWDAVTLGYRGVVTGSYTTTAEAAHAGGLAENAVQTAIDWYTRVETAVVDSGDRPLFERVTATPLAVTGGRATDGLATEATMEVEFRIPPGESVDTVTERVEGETESGTVEWTEGIEPVTESPRTPLGRAFRVAIREAGGEPRLLRKTGTSDMNVFGAAWDCPMLTYGPGDSALDHTPTEHLVLSEFDRAVEVLTAATEQLLSNTHEETHP